MKRALLFCALFGVACLGWQENRVWSEDGRGNQDKALIAHFNHGDRFYVDLNSFEHRGDGELFYKVVGDNRYTYTVTINSVDCGTGTFKSYLHITKIDKRNQATEQQSMNPLPVRLNKGTVLHGVLRTACMEKANLAEINW